MKLENHEGVIADPATVEDIAPAVAELTAIGKAYVILSTAGETYVQAAGTIAEGFILERRDGSAGDHYRADRRVGHEELTAILTAYLQCPPPWNVDEWHRVRFDFDGVVIKNDNG